MRQCRILAVRVPLPITNPYFSDITNFLIRNLECRSMNAMNHDSVDLSIARKAWFHNSHFLEKCHHQVHLREVGVETWQTGQNSLFLSFWANNGFPNDKTSNFWNQAITRPHFWNLGVVLSYSVVPKCHPNYSYSFACHIHSPFTQLDKPPAPPSACRFC